MRREAARVHVGDDPVGGRLVPLAGPVEREEPAESVLPAVIPVSTPSGRVDLKHQHWLAPREHSPGAFEELRLMAFDIDLCDVRVGQTEGGLKLISHGGANLESGDAVLDGT